MKDKYSKLLLFGVVHHLSKKLTTEIDNSNKNLKRDTGFEAGKLNSNILLYNGKTVTCDNS